MNILPLISIEPVNSEPLLGDTTTNPKLGETDAVTEPDAILGAAAACTFVNWEPSPMNVNAFTLPLTSTLPVNWDPNWEPVNWVSTLNPNTGDTDAVIEPDLISVDINASSVNAERGIFLKYCPSP